MNRDQVKKEVDIGCETIKNNIAPGNAPICCWFLNGKILYYSYFEGNFQTI